MARSAPRPTPTHGLSAHVRAPPSTSLLHAAPRCGLTPPVRRTGSLPTMRVAVSSDERTGVAEALVEGLRRRGHEPLHHGAYVEEERPDWAWASERAARDVAEGRAERGVVCCWTGTGASIAAN